MAYGVTHVLEYVGKLDIESYEAPAAFTISPETRYFSIQIRTKGPSYFNSIGRIYVYFSSPCANFFETFEVAMSLDNASWVNIPFYSFQSNDYSKFADLGLIGLDGLVITIYGRYHIPPQTMNLPSNVTKEDVLNGLKGNISIRKEIAPRDATVEFLVGITLFGAILRVLDLLFLKKEGNSALKPK